MFVIAQIAVVALILFGIIFFFGKIKKKEKGTVAALSVCAVIAAFISANIVGMIPLPTEQVTITATGEMNEKASSNEIAITGIYVAGEPTEFNKPAEGKWFWKGSAYMWRREGNPNQPDGTTRSITIEIPIGNMRSIDFNCSKWNGIAEVTYNGETKSYDCFKGEVNERGAVSAYIPDTDSVYLYGIKLLRLGLYAVIIAALLAYPVFCVLKYEYSVLRGVFVKHWDKLFYASLAVLYVFVVRIFSAGGSFWCDEMWTIGVIYAGAKSIEPASFAAPFGLWFDLVPYGQEYLRLFSQILVALAIYFAGLFGSRLKGKRFGILLSCLIATSLTVYYQASMGVRYSGMWFLQGVIVLYLLAVRQENLGKESIIIVLLYGASLTWGMNLHPYGFVYAGIFLIVDFLLIVSKKASKKLWLAFVFPCAYGIFWIFSFFGSYLNYSTIGWSGALTIPRVIETVRWLLSYNDIMLILAILGLIVVIAAITNKLLTRTFDFGKDSIIAATSVMPFIIIGFIFFYSTVLRPEKPIFVDRYVFGNTTICLLFLVAYAIDELIGFIGSIAPQKYAQHCSSVLAICVMIFFSWTEMGVWNPWPAAHRTRNDDFKSAADYVMTMNDIYNDKTLFIVDHNNINANSGIGYYITHNGERDDINHCSISKLPDNIEEYNVIYISNVYKGSRANPTLNELLDSEFQLSGDNTKAKVLRYVRIS